MLRAAFAGAMIALSAVAASAQVNSAELKWGPPPAGIPKGAEMAVVSGNPGNPGPFVVRVKMPAGYSVPAHHHPAGAVPEPPAAAPAPGAFLEKSLRRR